jgi:hypothetical protein
MGSAVTEVIIQLLRDLIPIVVPIYFLIFLAKFIRIWLGLEKPEAPEWKTADFKNPTIRSRKNGKVVFYFYVHYLEKQSRVKRWFQGKDEFVKIDKSYYKREGKKYTFTTDEALFEKIIHAIQKPISELKDDTILFQFHDAIHYALTSLEQLFKNGDIVNLNMETNRVCELVSEIKRFSTELENSANEQVERLRLSNMNNILEKHHLIMDQLTEQVKIFNEPVKTISLKKDKKSS